MDQTDIYLRCSDVIDCDTDSIKEKVKALIAGKENDREKAIPLFYFVRDEIKHNPYAPGSIPAHFKASVTLARGDGYCIQKAVLLVALARAAGIPARIGFADIRDHLISKKFKDMIGGDNLLLYHGYAELLIDSKWLHLSPQYELGKCRKAGFMPVEFDGINDARDPLYNRNGDLHIEQVLDHGTYADFPWEELSAAREEWVSKLGERGKYVAEWGKYS